MWFTTVLPAEQWSNRKVETNTVLPAKMNYHSLAGGVDCLCNPIHALRITISKGSYSLSCRLVTQQSEGGEVPGTAQLPYTEIFFSIALRYLNKQTKKDKEISPLCFPHSTLDWTEGQLWWNIFLEAFLIFWLPVWGSLLAYQIMFICITCIFLRVICISRRGLFPSSPHSLKIEMSTHYNLVGTGGLMDLY